MQASEGAVVWLAANDNALISLAENQGLEPGSFGSISGRHMWGALKELHDEGSHADMISLKARLEDKKLFDSCFTDFTSLGVELPVTSHFETYVTDILNHAVKRRVGMVSAEMKSMATGAATNDEIVTQMNEWTTEIEQMLNSTAGRSRVVTINEAVEEFVRGLEHDEVAEIPTGLMALDDFIGGLAPGGLYVLAGRPGLGKSSLALNIAQNWCAKGLAVGLISLEMSREEVALRALTKETGIPSEKIKRRILEDDDWALINQAKDRMKLWQLFINDSGEADVKSLAARIKSLVLQEQLDLVIVDYLQLLSSTGERWQAVGEISRSMKMIAKDMRIPVMALSQLNRKAEERPDKMPQLSDLRESGSIEQDANVVVLIHRKEHYDPDGGGSKPVATDLIVAKNRSGRRGTAVVDWNGAITAFQDVHPSVGLSKEGIPAETWDAVADHKLDPQSDAQPGVPEVSADGQRDGVDLPVSEGRTGSLSDGGEAVGEVG